MVCATWIWLEGTLPGQWEKRWAVVRRDPSPSPLTHLHSSAVADGGDGGGGGGGGDGMAWLLTFASDDAPCAELTVPLGFALMNDDIGRSGPSGTPAFELRAVKIQRIPAVDSLSIICIPALHFCSAFLQ